MPSSSSYSNSYSSSSSSSIGSSAEMNKIIGYGKSVELAYTQYQYAKALNSDLSDIVVPAGTDNSILLTIDGKSVNIAVDYDYDVTCIGNNTISMGKVSSMINNADGKFVIVGLPCHIQGFRKLLKIDKKFKDKILGLFSVYCSSCDIFTYRYN